MSIEYSIDMDFIINVEGREFKGVEACYFFI